jgi:2-polyprenyl-3-methyl-5-hydroxy-6-metoxy-1,4-benzoquinol methylase
MGQNTQCYLCQSTRLEQIEGKIRDLPELPILQCQECDLVFLESFDHIDPSYYSESHMYDDPKGESLSVEYDLDGERRLKYCKLLISNKKILDFGCGQGNFLLKAKEIAMQAHGLEPDVGDRSFFHDQGLTVFTDLREMHGEQYDVITLFHVLEHLHDPRETLVSLKSHLQPQGKILIEVPNADEALLKLYKNKGFMEFYWSCHLFLFTVKTLEKLLIQAGFQIDYIQQIQRYPLSNHLHWLTHNQPGGHLLWSFLDSERLTTEYANRLASLGMCDTLNALISKK